MSKINYAAIDIGSNAVRLLISGIEEIAALSSKRFLRGALPDKLGQS